ncbi:hypothetical protein BaRGS_00023553 [Batillaria attramentaria]|uniref:Myb/SANT-like DNA-binding domain-containing protein n=1 Tax=Batillaria attramentaria TaxID=370345 RepID=A0ABD0KDE0_9CAEN
MREKRVVLFCKLNNSITVRAKEAAWQEIATRVNAHHFSARHWKQMKKKWQDLKAEYIRIRALQKKKPTGGGPPPHA